MLPGRKAGANGARKEPSRQARPGVGSFVSSVSRHRRRRKIKRTGRHTAPSQAEKVAQKAGKAAPALAVVGALAAGPHVPEAAAPVRTAATAPVLGAHLDAAVRPARAARPAGHTSPGRTYTVRPGDRLSGIAQRFYGHTSDWRWLYQVNRSKIHNPGVIYPGQVLSIPRDPPAPAAHHTDGDGDHDGDRSDHKPYKPRHSRGGSGGGHGHGSGHGGRGGQGQGSGHHLGGTLNCHGLEALWRSAGGASWAAVTAASIAMAESGGHQYATGAAGERGYWQINPVNGALSTYDAYGNARAAVIMSHDGTNWSPWTTWVDGAYRGRC